MEGTATLCTPIGCDGPEWKFGSAMVVASANHTSDARRGGAYPFGLRFRT